MKDKKRLFVGWGIGKRPFTPTEFKSSYIGKRRGANYARYLHEFAQGYNKTVLNKTYIYGKDYAIEMGWIKKKGKKKGKKR